MTTKAGRPRAQDTIDRDKLIYDLVSRTGVTRNYIIGETGYTPKLVYLSLNRLKRQGRVAVRRKGSLYIWSRVD
jgi:hypothetical protein